jgi:Cu/Ag efflux protein CusF
VTVRLGAAVLSLAAALAAVVPAAAATSHVHGKIVAVDAAHHEVQIHHDPFAAMPMAMTMVVIVPNPADFAKLHKGAVVEADVDTSKDPWVLSHVKLVSSK